MVETPHNGVISIQSTGIKISYNFHKDPNSSSSQSEKIAMPRNPEKQPAPKNIFDAVFRVM